MVGLYCTNMLKVRDLNNWTLLVHPFQCLVMSTTVLVSISLLF